MRRLSLSLRRRDVLAAVVVAAVLAGVAAVVVVYRRQWHVRLLRQIRALPEHTRERSRT